MHSFKNISFLILSIFLLTTCEKKEDEFPGVETLNAEIPDDGGVILYGQLKGGASVDQYGFYYSQDSLFRDYQTVTQDEPINSGTFHAEINSELRPGEVYFYKAYIITNQTLMFGSTNIFLSTGSKSPEILQVIPEIAHISDTVKIYGKYFGKQLYYNYTKVIFCNADARIIQLCDSLITCIIPPGSMPYKPQIKVTSFNKSDSASFQLYKPLIESIFLPGHFSEIQSH